MVTLNVIQKFLEPRKMAIAGASRNIKKFGGVVFKELHDKGFSLYPINPNAEEIQGIKCYKSVDELPADVEHLLILTSKEETNSVVQAAITKGIKMIWIQQKSETTEALKNIKEAEIQLIYNKCIMMFAAPVKGVHEFHRFLSKTFGAYPKLVFSTN